MITVNSRKLDGSIRRSWNCELVEATDSLLVFFGIFAEDVDHPELGHIRAGTVSYEYYWLDRWYSIFRFHEPSGSLRNFYCNLNMPPHFADGVLDYVDLDIDVVVWPDASYKILDRDDYEQNAELLGYSDEVKEKVEATLKELLELIEVKDLPGVPDKIATSAAKVRGSS
ncbi:MAG TPA: DUF402 domain-containing protein [Pyrinomonadaceae bacterium]|nr:DUF402 domain-containing protein [Pyrinomonadaceae bacterium]